MWHARPIFGDDLDAIAELAHSQQAVDESPLALLDGVDLQRDATVVIADGRIVACGVYRAEEDAGAVFVDPQVGDQGIEAWLERWTGWRRDVSRG